MTALWSDSFEGYDDLTQRYDAVSSAVITSYDGRFSTGGLAFTSSGGYIKKTITTSGNIIVGLAWYANAAVGSGDDFIIKLSSGDTTQLTLGLSSGSCLSATSNGVTTTAFIPLEMFKWYYIEIKTDFVYNFFEVHVTDNGTMWVHMLGGGDIDPAGTDSVDGVWLGSRCNPYMDDLYILQVSGDNNNDFLGESRVITLYPSSDATYSEWTPSTGTTHYNLVNEHSVDVSDYVWTERQVRDTYNMTFIDETLKDGFFIQLNMYMKASAGIEIQPYLRSGEAQFPGTLQDVPTTDSYIYTLYDKRPDGAGWSGNGINNFEFGVWM